MGDRSRNGSRKEHRYGGDDMGAPTSILHRWLRKKPIEKLTGEVSGTPGDPDHLGRSITLFQLIMFGVGATVGTGIFFVLSETVPVAGPAVIVSFAIAGVVAGL